MNIILRPPLEEDAQAINELRRMPGVFETILGFPAEPLIRNQQHLSTYDPNRHMLMAVAVEEDGSQKVVGNGSLTVYGNPRLRHSGSIGMMVHRDYQGQGVGTQLLAGLLDLADNWLMLERVDLSVFVDNHRAIALYKKFGFEIEGTRRKAAIRDGAYVDDYVMARIRPQQQPDGCSVTK